MKKSNKLLIVLIVFFTSALVLYNVLLNAQLRIGNIVNVEIILPPGVTVQLKPFQHIVFSGTQITKEYPKSTSRRDLTLEVSTDTTGKYAMYIPTFMRTDLDYHYKGDTLFISFSSKHKRIGREAPDTRFFPLHVFVPGLSSVSANTGLVDFNEFNQKEPLFLYLKSPNLVKLTNVNLLKLELDAGRRTSLRVQEKANVDSMTLSLGEESSIRFYSLKNIKTIIPVQLDSTAEIAVEGKAKDMKEHLQKLQ